MQITLTLDDQGDHDANICTFGNRAYCCPSDSAPTAPQCKQISSWGGKCSSDLPQKVGTVSGVIIDTPVCCSADVKYNNCQWYGFSDPFSCVNSQCPVVSGPKTPSIRTQVHLTQRDRGKLRSTQIKRTTRPTGASSAPLIRSAATQERGTSPTNLVPYQGFINSEQQVRVGHLTR